MKTVTTFPNHREFEKAKACLDTASLPYQVISPEPAYTQVGVPALILDEDGRAALFEPGSDTCICSGWVNYQSTRITVPQNAPPAFEEDIFGTCAIMVLASCVADVQRIRIIAHISGNLAPVLSYLNADLPHGLYNSTGPIFTLMDEHRLISLYAHRLTIAKADDMVDAWRTLESLRVWVNDIWQRRASMTPSFQIRRRPPALEVHKRLPGTNCGLCGQKTCMAFALNLWGGEADPSNCKPIFEGDYQHLKSAFITVCVALGFTQLEDTNDAS